MNMLVLYFNCLDHSNYYVLLLNLNSTFFNGPILGNACHVGLNT